MRDLRAVQHATTFGVTAARAGSADTHWAFWADFCTELSINPFLQGVDDPIVYIQVFLHRFRTGVIAPRGRPVRARSAEDAIRSVGQTFAAMGALDPRYTSQGNMDFCLTRQLRFYKKADPPPDRVKPVPIAVLHWIAHAAALSPHPGTQAIADMTALAFFFLLRPGEYTATPSDTTPFIADVRLASAGTYLDWATAPDNAFSAPTFTTLTFTTQKNGVRGEVIGLGRSGHPHLCPVCAITRRLLHLRRHGALPDTPLAVYFFNNTWCHVTPADITSVLRAAVTALGPARLGFQARDISARALRAAGVMAILCANNDTDNIWRLCHWRSDEMLCYLHLQAEPIMRNFARDMLSGGAFVLLPNANVPITGAS